MRREIFTVLVSAGAGIGTRPFTIDTKSRIEDVVSTLLAVYNIPSSEDRDKLADVLPEEFHREFTPISQALDEFEAWSWDCRSMDGRTRIGQIPAPGMLLVLERAWIAQQDPEMDVSTLLFALKRELVHPEEGSEKLRRFLTGPWARWKPQPISTTDVLIVNSPEEESVAADLEARLSVHELTVARTTRSGDGALGGEDERRLLAGCQVLLSLLGPNSLHDTRVACEAGACWVLGKPFVPLLSGLSRDDLPPSMAARQCIVVDEAGALDRLPDQIAILVLGT